MTLRVVKRGAEIGRDVAEAARILREGGVVVFPTDTLYGLGAGVWNAVAVERVAAIKGRDRGRGLPVLLAEPGDAISLTEGSPALEALAEAFWPGGLTVVAPAREGVNGLILGPGGTVGLRVPDSEMARRLIRLARTQLTGTSANRGGSPPPVSAQAAWEELGTEVDYVLDGGQAGGQASTVVDISRDPPAVLREGGVTLAELRRLLGSVAGPER